MSEEQNPQTAGEPRRRTYWHLLGITSGFLVFPAIFITASKTGVWVNAVVGFVTFGIPLLLIGYRSWNRWFHPDLTPVRWQQRSFLNKHHDLLEVILTLLWCPLFCVAVFLDEHRHSEAKVVSYFLVFGCQGWLSWLKLSTADRKASLPPSTPSDHSKNKPLRSERWGERQVGGG